MSKIHVCLVSDQPIPNLTTILQFKPDKVILLATPDMDNKAKYLKKIVKSKDIEVGIIRIEAYDMNNVIEVSEELLKNCANEYISLNITGGTKIGTLGTFQVFWKNNKDIFYVDTRGKRILNLFSANKNEKEIPINIQISIKDYLSAYGFKIKTWNQNIERDIEMKKELTNCLAGMSACANYIISAINSELHKYDERYRKYPLTFKPPRKLIEECKKIKMPEGIELSGDEIKINDVKSLMYLKGFWFEEYVYMAVKSISPDEIMCNVNGEWPTQNSLSPKNEFDILFSKGNRLFFISCKTADPHRKEKDKNEGIGKEFLYELDSLGDKALGLFGKRMLASAIEIKDDFIKARAKTLNIDILDGEKIINIEKHLKEWIE